MNRTRRVYFLLVQVFNHGSVVLLAMNRTRRVYFLLVQVFNHGSVVCVLNLNLCVKLITLNSNIT